VKKIRGYGEKLPFISPEGEKKDSPARTSEKRGRTYGRAKKGGASGIEKAAKGKVKLLQQRRGQGSLREPIPRKKAAQGLQRETGKTRQSRLLLILGTRTF